ncbi:pentapeptide repeat-containing protein [Rhodomicrobium lacus]|uniref:pentapeptide repeat-containing protein n=1 Tax=Rhodomicrobium lacus TaxID=2498452 RepID=UPI0013DEB3A4|nr:pentapeptide repeat-containing protein [Rhodomicrobium lacus]
MPDQTEEEVSVHDARFWKPDAPSKFVSGPAAADLLGERATKLSAFLGESQRIEYKDKALRNDIGDDDWSNLQLIRFVAIKKKFRKINFSNTTFDLCYLRDCQFDSCNFTGSRFSSTNLHGARFIGCIFDYATFERTIIDDTILDDNCPAYENHKMRFARSLRTNFQQIGDAAAVNRAMRVELDAAEIHLYKSWSSNDYYYRKKYKSVFIRVKQFSLWAKFKFLDYLWGNGESLSALLRAVLVLIVAIAILDLATAAMQLSLNVLFDALWRAPQIFFGVGAPSYISLEWLTAITVLRLTFFGLFMSILVKRFNRR